MGGPVHTRRGGELAASAALQAEFAAIKAAQRTAPEWEDDGLHDRTPLGFLPHSQWAEPKALRGLGLRWRRVAFSRLVGRLLWRGVMRLLLRVRVGLLVCVWVVAAGLVVTRGRLMIGVWRLVI